MIHLYNQKHRTFYNLNLELIVLVHEDTRKERVVNLCIGKSFI